MNIVKSQEKDDCGICALACATGKPWHMVKAAVWAGRVARRLHAHSPTFGNHDHDSCATSGLDLIDAAGRLGWKALYRRVAPCSAPNLGAWDDLKAVVAAIREAGSEAFAVVKVQYHNTRRSHWVVYDGNMVYDNCWDCPATAGRTYPLVPLSYVPFAKAT